MPSRMFSTGTLRQAKVGNARPSSYHTLLASLPNSNGVMPAGGVKMNMAGDVLLSGQADSIWSP